MSNYLNTDSKNLPAPYRRRRYYTPTEVRSHKTANDCWVSFFNEVFDLTDLIQKNYSSLTDPIVKRAGTDITDWFDAETRDVKLLIIKPKVCIVSGTSIKGYFCVNGPYLHLPPDFPDADWDASFALP
jgi:hypothetical protein